MKSMHVIGVSNAFNKTFLYLKYNFINLKWRLYIYIYTSVCVKRVVWGRYFSIEFIRYNSVYKLWTAVKQKLILIWFSFALLNNYIFIYPFIIPNEFRIYKHNNKILLHIITKLVRSDNNNNEIKNPFCTYS